MKIFVGCSSSNNISKEYFESCKSILKEILPGNELVFGACNSGIMGIAYDTAIDNNCPVVGICPEAYKSDFLTLNCNKEITTKSVSERTNSLINNSDILLFLPGGIGTIYELFTTIESKRCHEFNKPIVICNCNGFYNYILALLDKIYAEGFSKYSDSNNYYISSNYSDIIKFINKQKNNNLAKFNKK